MGGWLERGELWCWRDLGGGCEFLLADWIVSKHTASTNSKPLPSHLPTRSTSPFPSPPIQFPPHLQSLNHPIQTVAMFIFIFRTTLSGTTTYRLIGLFPTHAAAANTGVRLWMILAGKVSPTSKGIDGAFEVYVPEMRYVIQVVGTGCLRGAAWYVL
jgi:ABC-type uncharacterized transport system permease subunit